MNRLFLGLVGLPLAFTLLSCEKFKLEGDLIREQTFISQLYTNASDTIIIDHQPLILETELSRDFFPGTIQRKNHRLMASLRIVNTDSAQITTALSIFKLHIINHDEVWISEPGPNVDAYTPVYELALLSKDGPEWPTGITVDVVISFIDQSDNSEKFLIARKQTINKAS